MKQGWEIKKLGEVCVIVGGGTPSKKIADYYFNGEIAWATVRDMKVDIIHNTEYKITKEAIISSATNIIPSGNVIVATRVGLGKICLLGNDTAINQDIKGVIPKKRSQLLSTYLFLWFKTISSKIIDEGTGATVQGVKLPFISNLSIPIPPLPEQQRIVSILDEAFAAIDKAKANAEQNHKNAKELFASYLQKVFENGSWEKKKLGDLCNSGSGGTPLKNHKDHYDGGKIPWLRSGEVDKKDIVESENFITEKGLKNSSARLFPVNTILIAMYGATAGQVGILRFECSTNQAVCGILPNIDFIPEFLYYKFIAGKEALVSLAVGGAQPNISQIKIKNTLVPVISIKEQQTIVNQLDALQAETLKLEAIYQKKLNNLEELKKSILQKAFTGEL